MTLQESDRKPGQTVRQQIIEEAYKGNQTKLLALLSEVKVLDGQEVYEALLSQVGQILRGRGRKTPPHG